MPPCAHTECERFTGTMEKRSTLAPISAILMTAESPARPPPMTIIFGAAAIVPLSAFCELLVISHCGARFNWLLRARPERSQAGQSRAGQNEKECQTQHQKSLPRPFPGNDPPLRRKQPDAISEVPRSRDQPRNIKKEKGCLEHFPLHLAERCVRVSVQIDPGKAHRPRMPNDVGKSDAAGPALRRVHPVAAPGIGDRVSVAAVPNVETVECVKRDRQPDPKQLE